MNKKSWIASVALAGALATVAHANAATIPLAPAGPGMFSGSIDVQADGLVIDDFDFDPASFAGLVSVTLSNLGGPVSFFTAAFFPDTANEVDFSNLSEGVGSDFSFSAGVTADAPLTLRVFGAVTEVDGNLGGVGTYRLSVTEAIAAVPEPQTWALLLGGLAAVVLSTRRSLKRKMHLASAY